METTPSVEFRSGPRWIDDWIVWILLIGFSASLLCNVVLGWRLRDYKRDTRRLSDAKHSEARIGISVPVLNVNSLTGVQQTLKFIGDRPTIIYIFSPSCYWCAKNLPNIEALASAKKNDFNFIGISNTSSNLADYLTNHQLPFPIYVMSPSTNGKSLGYEGTPQTVVIGRGGEIERNWPGAYGGAVKAEVESFFGIELPKNTPPGATH